MTRPRIVFMGTAPLAAVSLTALAAHTEAWLLTAVVTQPDRPRGRNLQLQPSAVKEVAIQLGLPVLQPLRAREPSFVEQLRSLQPDLIVVAAYGQILPPEILELPPWRCINVHASLLPRYRGAAPIQWAIINGDPETGVTIMLMEPTLDTGPILSQRATPIAPGEDAPRLHDRLARLGADLLVETIPDYLAGRLHPRPQPSEGASYARKLTREDGLLDWSLSAAALENRVRGLTPWPGTYTHVNGPGGPVILKVLEARAEGEAAGEPGRILEAGPKGVVVQCGRGALRLLVLQREGGRRLSAEAFVAGTPLKPGMSLAPSPQAH